ncbi:Heat shock 70 kDa protein [Hondaea fermentalgiana]|uniref:Heat shock 70 kDa protein n=1 Tax=Hondaea fermentalgiana TaxID=2315210 RepID=A0A2R5GQ18_9STRA|nr:Heat shock 70 kDa protein [Hondaea fermentalgiana]|eukprot:GBG32976.1 Heat shock 70 kDa protein [Hondaea fermentalgiana]
MMLTSEEDKWSGDFDAQVGIDLGTTNSCVSIWVEDLARAKTIKCQKTGLKTVPSVVWVDASNTITAVGQDALAAQEEAKKKNKEEEEGSQNSEGVLIRGAKRFLGRRFQDIDAQGDGLASLAFSVRERKSDGGIVLGAAKGEGGVEPEQVAGAILDHLCEVAQAYVAKRKAKITHAVITVPAFFTDRQRVATRRVAESRGLRVLRLLSEPMAAAMAYGLFVAGSKIVMVVDMGGGTFDVSLLRITNGKFEAIALRGDNHLGGDDVDALLMQHVSARRGVALKDMSNSEKSRLRSECEQAKCVLSSEEHAWVTDDIDITRESFEALTLPLQAKIESVLAGALEDAREADVKIDEVVMVGLSTQMPWVRRVVLKTTGVTELCVNVKADRAVSQGAAIQAAILSGTDSYKLAKVLMIDALPFTIGVETGSGDLLSVLARNTKFPCKVTRTFTTHSDYQRGITIDLFEGEALTARENHWVGCRNFPVHGGSKLRAGEASIDVTFEISDDGTLLVGADTQGSTDVKDEPAQGPDMTLLSALLALLVAIFVAAKIYFPPPVSNGF